MSPAELHLQNLLMTARCSNGLRELDDLFVLVIAPIFTEMSLLVVRWRWQRRRRRRRRMLVVGSLVGAPGSARNGQAVPELLRRGVPVATGQDLVPVGNGCGRLR